MTKTRPKNPPSQTGLSANLAAFLHIQGIGTSKITRHPRLRFTGVALCMTLGCLLFSVSSATAAETHLYQESFGPGGTAATAFEQPAAVGIDQSTGEIYVANVPTGTIEKFNSAHQPEAFDPLAPNVNLEGRLTGFRFRGLSRQIAVDNDSGSPSFEDFYVPNRGEETNSVEAFQPDGKPADFSEGPDAGTNGIVVSEVCGVAVDSSGDIYVGTYYNVEVYAPGGKPLTSIATGEGACNLAVDANGTVYVNRLEGAVEKFTPSGPSPVTSSTSYAAAGVVDQNASYGVAVDPANNDLYVDEHNRIAQYEQDGTRVSSFGAEGAGALTASEGLAVDGATGRVYASDAVGEHQVGVFGPEVVLPDVATEPASHLTARSVTLTGTVDPDGAGEAKCRFEWGTTKGFGKVAACEPEGVASGPSPVPVHAALGGLEPDTEYCYRLQAGNVNGTNLGEASQDRCFTTAGLEPQAGSASAVTSESATLNATLRPGQEPTTFYFQYGTTAGYGSDAPLLSAAAPDGAAVAFQEGAVDVTPQPIHSLSPGTVYHYRVVEVIKAAGGVETLGGPDHTFTTQGAGGSLALADHRQWELVSPASSGAEILPIVSYAAGTEAAVSGDAIAYVTTAPTGAEPAGNSNFTQVLSSRTSSGWGSRDLAIPHSVGTGFSASFLEYPGVFSSDLSSSVVQPFGPFDPSLSAEASEQTGYLRSDYLGGEPGDFCTSSCYRPLVTGAKGFANVPQGVNFGGNSQTGLGCPPSPICGPQVLAATPDLRHVVFTSDVPLTSTPGDTGHLYEWSEGQIHYIGEGGPGQGAQQSDLPPLVDPRFDSNAISANGSRVFFTEDPGDIEEGPLNVRDVTTEETLRISPGDGLFEGASSEGSRVFYTEAGGLFECALAEVAGKLQCTTVELASGVQGVIGASEDGSSVYFVTDDALAGASEQQCREETEAEKTGAEPKQTNLGCNLYLYHAGSTAFIATLSAEDAPDWTSSITGENASPGTFTFQLTARVSPNGRWLAFMSQRSLTGYDNTDATSPAPCGAAKGICDEEVYLYHAPAGGGSGGAGSLTCASCNPTGARPHGVEYEHLNTQNGGLAGGAHLWNKSQWLAANVPGWTSTYHQSRYLSNEGRLFFNSSDALVPQDVNNTEDVYEYEPPAGGEEEPPSDSCTTDSSTYSVRSEGCVSLVSSGTSPSESAFLDSSENGDDVFFLSSGELTPQSRGGLSVFDARVGGGEPEPAKPVECQGDACQSPYVAPENPAQLLQGPPGGGGPNSLTPAPPPVKKVTKKTVKCKKGFAKNKKGQCVKKKSKKQAKKSTRRGK